MFRTRTLVRLLVPALVVVVVVVTPAFADATGVSQIQSFIQSIIQVLITLAGLLAAGFLVWGGITYITSSGNPQSLDKAKKTIIYASLGLAIAIGADSAFFIGSVLTITTDVRFVYFYLALEHKTITGLFESVTDTRQHKPSRLLGYAQIFRRLD